MSSLMFIVSMYENENGEILQILILFTLDPYQAEMEA